MANKKYDEIIKQPLDKLAQTMSDITYTYKETVVPKTHYKKEMSKVIEQELDQIVDLKILSVYVETLNRIKTDSPRLYAQALVCVDQGIKIGTSGLRPNEMQALEIIAQTYSSNKDSLIKEEVIDLYRDVLENGLLIDEKEINETISNDKDKELEIN